MTETDSGEMDAGGIVRSKISGLAKKTLRSSLTAPRQRESSLLLTRMRKSLNIRRLKALLQSSFSLRSRLKLRNSLRRNSFSTTSILKAMFLMRSISDLRAPQVNLEETLAAITSLPSSLRRREFQLSRDTPLFLIPLKPAETGS